MKGFWSRGLLSILILSLVLAVIFSLSACGSTDLKTTPAPTPTPMPTPTPTPEAEFEVVSLDIMPPEVVIGEEVTITAKVANIGKCEGTYTAVLMINGVEVERKDLTVSPEASELVSFKLTEDAEGTYAVKVAQLSKTLVVREPTAKFEDSANDLFNKAGISWAGVGAYVDITESELTLSNGYYLARIKLSSPLPPKTDDPSIFIEWDIFIDSDCDAGTGHNWPLVINDIGADYLLRLTLIDSTYAGQVINLKNNARGSIEYEIDGNIVKLHFSSETIGEPASFNFVVAVRKYGERGAPQALQVADKAPNEGHYVFPDHHTSDESAPQGNFDEITYRLNSPVLVSSYLEDNFTVQRKPSHNPDAREVFSLMSGDCDEYAILAVYWLTENEYDAYALKVDFNKWWEEYNCWLRHVICTYKEEDGTYYSIDSYFHGSGRNPVGPFNSISEICDQLPAHYEATDWIRYQLFDSNWSLIKTEAKGD